MRRIRDKPSIYAIHQKIECLKNRLADYYLITENKRVFDRISPIDVNLDWLGHSDALLSPVGRFYHSLSTDCEVELLDYMRRKHRANRAGINQGIRSVGMHLVRRELPPAH